MINIEDNYVVYQYLRAEDEIRPCDDGGYVKFEAGSVYYVGEGRPQRPYNPHSNVEVPADRDLIEILDTGLTKVEAQQLESRLIASYGRWCPFTAEGCLDNRSIFGTGCNPGGEHPHAKATWVFDFSGLVEIVDTKKDLKDRYGVTVLDLVDTWIPHEKKLFFSWDDQGPELDGDEERLVPYLRQYFCRLAERPEMVLPGENAHRYRRRLREIGRAKKHPTTQRYRKMRTNYQTDGCDYWYWSAFADIFADLQMNGPLIDLPFNPPADPEIRRAVRDELWRSQYERPCGVIDEFDDDYVEVNVGELIMYCEWKQRGEA